MHRGTVKSGAKQGAQAGQRSREASSPRANEPGEPDEPDSADAFRSLGGQKEDSNIELTMVSGDLDPSLGKVHER